MAAASSVRGQHRCIGQYHPACTPSNRKNVVDVLPMKSMTRPRRRRAASGIISPAISCCFIMLCTTAATRLFVVLTLISSSISRNNVVVNHNSNGIPALVLPGISSSRFAMAFQLPPIAPYRHKTAAATTRSRTSTVVSTEYALSKISTCLFSEFNNENEDDANSTTTTTTTTTIDIMDHDIDGSNNDDDIPTPTASVTSTTTSFSSSSIFQRFLNPRIDDPGLLLSDALLAQIVAPTLQIYWLLLVNAPSPSWLHPISGGVGSGGSGGNNLFATASSSLYDAFSSRGSLLAPTLVHGAGLAVCWLAGALAAKMFEREAFTLQQTTFIEMSTTTMKDKRKEKDRRDNGLLLQSEESSSTTPLLDSTIITILRSYQPILTRLVQAYSIGFTVGI